MDVIKTTIPDVLVLQPKTFGDARGFFMESYNEEKFSGAVGRPVRFVQDNHSRSPRGVLRGLHYQTSQTQGKLVRVTSGEVFDVAVDLRKSSPTFGRWAGEILSGENKKQLWVPEGFAHGFVVLSDTADFLYKTTDYYAPQFEQTLMWNDPSVNVDWHFSGTPSLSAKDQAGLAFDKITPFA